MMSPFKPTFLIQFETDFETDHFLNRPQYPVLYCAVYPAVQLSPSSPHHIDVLGLT